MNIQIRKKIIHPLLLINVTPSWMRSSRTLSGYVRLEQTPAASMKIRQQPSVGLPGDGAAQRSCKFPPIQVCPAHKFPQICQGPTN